MDDKSESVRLKRTRVCVYVCVCVGGGGQHPLIIAHEQFQVDFQWIFGLISSRFAEDFQGNSCNSQDMRKLIWKITVLRIFGKIMICPDKFWYIRKHFCNLPLPQSNIAHPLRRTPRNGTEYTSFEKRLRVIACMYF